MHQKYTSFEEASAALEAFNSTINSIPSPPPSTLPPYQVVVAGSRSCWFVMWEKCVGALVVAK